MIFAKIASTSKCALAHMIHECGREKPFIRFDNYYFQESLSGQQSSFYANNEFIGGTKSTDFSSIQGNDQRTIA